MSSLNVYLSPEAISLIDDSAVSVPCYHCNRYQDFSSAFQFAKVIYFFNFWGIESPFNSILRFQEPILATFCCFTFRLIVL